MNIRFDIDIESDQDMFYGMSIPVTNPYLYNCTVTVIVDDGIHFIYKGRGDQLGSLRNAMDDFLNGRDAERTISSHFDWSTVKPGFYLDIRHLDEGIQEVIRLIMDAKLNKSEYKAH